VDGSLEKVGAPHESDVGKPFRDDDDDMDLAEETPTRSYGCELVVQQGGHSLTQGAQLVLLPRIKRSAELAVGIHPRGEPFPFGRGQLGVVVAGVEQGPEWIRFRSAGASDRSALEVSVLDVILKTWFPVPNQRRIGFLGRKIELRTLGARFVAADTSFFEHGLDKFMVVERPSTDRTRLDA
jgi:hypothetical protein